MGATEAVSAYKNNGKDLFIPAVVYYSVWYQNGIKMVSLIPPAFCLSLSVNPFL